MPQGLDVGGVVAVTVDITQSPAGTRNFGLMCAIGDSNVISGSERYRNYFSLDAVGDDFGLNAPEYAFAEVYFAQSPMPAELVIGRWIRTATAAFLQGGVLSSDEQDIGEWDTIDNGSFSITIDGDVQDLTDLDFTSATTLTNVAAVINGSLTNATIAWDGSEFIITNTLTGSSSTISYASPVSPATGTDISSQLKLTSSTSLPPVDGYDVETPLEAVVALAEITSSWYACNFASSVMPDQDDEEEIAAYIEATTPVRIYCITDQDSRTLSSTYTADISSVLKAAGYERTFTQYSSSNPYASGSLFGRYATVDFNANNTVITGFGKQEPGITYEVLTDAQAQTLKNKRANVFVLYQNNTSIIQWGTMVSNLYIDERQGIDWLVDALQTSCYNVLLTAETKVPQTDAGNGLINNQGIVPVLNQAVNNGLVAGGYWTGQGFGQIKQGQYLANGYYIYQPSIALQSAQDRADRKSVSFQVAVLLAGAIQQVAILLNISR